MRNTPPCVKYIKPRHDRQLDLFSKRGRRCRGFVVAGYVNRFANAVTTIWVAIKLDKDGNQFWEWQVRLVGLTFGGLFIQQARESWGYPISWWWHILEMVVVNLPGVWNVKRFHVKYYPLRETHKAQVEEMMVDAKWVISACTTVLGQLAYTLARISSTCYCNQPTTTLLDGCSCKPTLYSYVMALLCSQ